MLLPDAFGERLRTFLAAFEPLRAAEGKRLADPSAYEALPGGPAVRGARWRLRGYDLEVIAPVGSAARAARARRERVERLAGASPGAPRPPSAVDYFVDACDGLRAPVLRHHLADRATRPGRAGRAR
jgi:hypothetical protein